MKLFLAISAPLLLSGCALFNGASSTRAEIIRQPSAIIDPVGALEPASLVTQAPQARGRAPQPVGLVPCAENVFPAQNCWRRGDQHVLFPDAPPDGLASSSLVSADQ